MATTQEIFGKMNETLSSDPSRAGGLNAVYQFNLTGEDGGIYQLILRTDAASAVTGEQETPDCTLEMTADNFKKLVAGKLNGAMAVMTGKLKVKGELGLAMKLQNVLGAYSA